MPEERFVAGLFGASLCGHQGFDSVELRSELEQAMPAILAPEDYDPLAGAGSGGGVRGCATVSEPVDGGGVRHPKRLSKSFCSCGVLFNVLWAEIVHGHNLYPPKWATSSLALGEFGG